MPKTHSPFTFFNVQALLSSLGFEMSHNDNVTKRIHFVKKGAKKPLKDTDVITILHPDFTADGHTESVFDRNDVINMIIGLVGGDASSARAKILAVLHQKDELH